MQSIISQLLSAGANTARSLELNDGLDPEGLRKKACDRYALELACRAGLTDIFEMLVSYDADTALRNCSDKRPPSITTRNSQRQNLVSITLFQNCFLYSARTGATGILEIMLQRKLVNPDFSNREQRTPLYWAALNGHAAVVKQLLDTEKVNINFNRGVSKKKETKKLVNPNEINSGVRLGRSER